MIVNKLITKILDDGIEQIKQPENMRKLQVNLVDPMISYTYKRLYPYFLITTIIFLLTFVLALLIFMIILKQTLRKN